MANVPEFAVEGWTVRPGLNLIERAGNSVKLEPRTMDLLVCLAEHAPAVVSTDELIHEVWGGRVISDGSIYQRINQLRNAFGDSVPDLIETIPKRGYRLVPSVSFLPEQLAQHHRSAISSRASDRRLATAAIVGTSSIILAAILLSLWARFPTPSELETQTIAVLPFANTSGDGTYDYLGEGIAGEIIHALSNSSELRVVARTSSFSFQDTSLDIQQIGERLGASVVLEGSVGRDDDRLRVTAQLIDSETGYHVWSDAYDLLVADLVGVEREISLAVAERLMTNDADLARVAAALPPVSDITAYEYYLLGRERMRNPSGLIRNWSTADADRSVEYFRRAVALEPSFARAYTALAEALLSRAVIGRGFSSPDAVPGVVAEEALAAIDRAEELAPELAETRYARGLAARVLYQDEDLAFDLFRQAIVLDPNLARAHYRLGVGTQGEEGLAALRKAAQLDPMSSEVHRWLWRVLKDLGRIQESALHEEQFASLEPGSWEALWRRARARSSAGRPDDAIRILQPRLGDENFQHGLVRMRVGIADNYTDLGDYEAAEARLDLLEQSDYAGSNWDEAASVANSRIHIALARGDLELVAALVHGGYTRDVLEACYEMLIGHDDHARETYQELDTQRGLLSRKENFAFGYYPAVNAAHLDLRAGDEEASAATLESARRALEPAFEDQIMAGGAYYLLASIYAIEGEREQALEALEEALARGWTHHWYAVRDPNLASLWGEPRFQAQIAGLRQEMDRLRMELEPLVALE